jgi:flagellar protein FliO/FliZ
MQNAKCKLDYARCYFLFCLLPFAFCLLHWSALPALADPSDVQPATYVDDSADAPLKKPNRKRPPAKPVRASDESHARSLPLPPRGAARDAEADKPNAGRPIKPGSSIATGLASLAVVLGLFLAAAWAVRRGLPAGPAKLPNDVVEVLGRTPLAGRQFAHLIRCGNKLLLVYLAPGCAETLTEITDPVEVDRLAGLCRQAHPHSSTSSFRQVFQQFSREKK